MPYNNNYVKLLSAADIIQIKYVINHTYRVLSTLQTRKCGIRYSESAILCIVRRYLAENQTIGQFFSSDHSSDWKRLGPSKFSLVSSPIATYWCVQLVRINLISFVHYMHF